MAMGIGLVGDGIQGAALRKLFVLFVCGFSNLEAEIFADLFMESVTLATSFWCTVANCQPPAFGSGVKLNREAALELLSLIVNFSPKI